jgi:hypothetical protein
VILFFPIVTSISNPAQEEPGWLLQEWRSRGHAETIESLDN